MEERFSGIKNNQILKIVITGPESTGKTSLTSQLAEHYHTTWIPEYARTYIAGLNRDYDYNDLVRIAERQILELKNLNEFANKLIFYDTGLIITKIWFREVYRKHPNWLDVEIRKNKPDLYLLCYYDLPWQFDLLRENGSTERRSYLYELYRREIEKIGCNYHIIKGFNQERFNLAFKFVDQLINDNVGK